VCSSDLSSLPVNGGDNWLGNNPEKNVLFLEQMLYQNTDAVKANSACTNGIRNNTLVSDISKICTFHTPNFYNTITPISMKIFSWTRFFVLQKQVYGQDQNLAPAHVLLCSSGFEQHWGQCKKHFMEPKNFEEKWNNKVLSAAELTL
jgi:hypothetical protein